MDERMREKEIAKIQAEVDAQKQINENIHKKEIAEIQTETSAKRKELEKMRDKLNKTFDNDVIIKESTKIK